ncbi:MAG TPA: hypothetical protein VE596_03445 [Gaiellaceae bacterium]|jgi:hypothetical protein|nr:hypothetical protein [Gaiellaceae bacterium]
MVGRRGAAASGAVVVLITAYGSGERTHVEVVIGRDPVSVTVEVLGGE